MADLTLVDIFPEAAEAAFIEELITEIQGKLGGNDLQASDLITLQEAVAFLGNIQRADNFRKRTRIRKWADATDQQLSISDALLNQLSPIGSRADSEYIEALSG